MISTLVHIWVKSANRADFIEACNINHEASILESGNLRFDFLQDATDENKFVLYEAYESEEAAIAHKDTSHYLTWRNKVTDWMAQPRKGEKHLIIAPTDRSKW